MTSQTGTAISFPVVRTGTLTLKPGGWTFQAISRLRSTGEPLRFPGRYLWVVSRSLLYVGDFHQWIYRSCRRAEEQWTRTAEHGFGCTEIGCDCGG
jgi:hypothetical protein